MAKKQWSESPSLHKTNWGDIVFVELPEIDTLIEQENPFGVVESVKTVSDLYAPVSGTVTAVNKDLEAHPEQVNDEPYGNGLDHRNRSCRC